MGREDEEGERLLSDLEDLLKANGAADFLFAPIRLPVASDFPDEWSFDLESARAMLRRLMAYARLGALQHSLRLADDPGWEREDDEGEFEPPHPDAAGFFAGVNRHGTYLFGLRREQLGDPMALAGILAHETAHAWRFRRDITRTHDATEERLTDVSSVFLGFGVLSASIAHRDDRALEKRGYLPVGAVAFLLGVQLLARNDEAQWKRVMPHLPLGAALVVEAVKDRWGPHRAALLERLGLPEDGAVLPRATPAVPSPWRRAVKAGRDIVFRVRAAPVAMALAVSGGLGPLVAMANWSPWPLLLVLATPLAWLVRRDVCSGCGAVLAPAAQRCRSCGGDVVGRIGRRSQHAAAEQRWLAEEGDGRASTALDIARGLLDAARSEPPGE